MRTQPCVPAHRSLASSVEALIERHRAPAFRSTSDCIRLPELLVVLSLPMLSAAEYRVGSTYVHCYGRRGSATATSKWRLGFPWVNSTQLSDDSTAQTQLRKPPVYQEEGFYKLLLLLLSYGTILAVERQTWCGTAPACREPMRHLYGVGDARYSRDETDTGC